MWVSLRGRVIEQEAELPDGRTAVIRIGVPDDDYVRRSVLEAVALELTVEGRVEAALTTVLEPGQEDEALALAREIASGLRTGDLEPTAGALEPLASTVPAT
jgi:hypothetical protein